MLIRKKKGESLPHAIEKSPAGLDRHAKLHAATVGMLESQGHR